ncbi:MAG: sigma-70 family RNA polymerase sigma factor [Myxococcales bacterium]|jgi:RNA polymerase sigma-70 factor (ECF subfamily)|nr:MAG: sigma-70 family RNA polymerase sigma factor [Myxococcales bacterium]
MPGDQKNEVTRLLSEHGAEGGSDQPSPQAAELLPLVYSELRRLANHYLQAERAGHTLQATALVHEAYMRLVDQTRVEWQGRTHFFAVAAKAMRRVLVDHARMKLRDKRGGGMQRVTLGEDVPPRSDGFLGVEDVIALDEALSRLAELDPRQAAIVEQRVFAGSTLTEAAANLGVSLRTAETDWAHAKAWLSRELAESGGR